VNQDKIVRKNALSDSSGHMLEMAGSYSEESKMQTKKQMETSTP